MIYLRCRDMRLEPPSSKTGVFDEIGIQIGRDEFIRDACLRGASCGRPLSPTNPESLVMVNPLVHFSQSPNGCGHCKVIIWRLHRSKDLCDSCARQTELEMDTIKIIVVGTKFDIVIFSVHAVLVAIFS